MNPINNPDPVRPRVRTSETWAQHFCANRSLNWKIPWQSEDSLPAPDFARVQLSIAEFQRGESSEAKSYLAKSEVFSARSGDPAFHAVSILFVREENEHAALLLRFMERVGIPRTRRRWTDGVFRQLRGGRDLGRSTRVLLVAELIAQAYYPCLRVATAHPALVRICDKIIADEAAHIQFQVERIVRVEAGFGPRRLAARDRLQAILMLGAAVVVYLGHGRVLRARLGCWQFVTEVVRRNRESIQAMKNLRQGSSFGLSHPFAAAR